MTYLATITQAPPVDLTASSAQRWIIAILTFAAAIGMTIYILRGQRGRELKIRILVLLGGGLGILYEALAEYLGGYWNATKGNWLIFEQYGHHVPLWHVPVYYLFLGGFSFIVFDRARHGASAASLWRLYAIFFIVDVVLEDFLIGKFTNLARYYGNQPFFSETWSPLPLWYPAINGVWPLVIGAVITLTVALRLDWLLPFTIVSAVFATYAITAWPTWLALNSNVSTPVSYLAGTLTIVFCLLLGYFVITALTQRRTLTAPPIPRPATTNATSASS